MAPLWHILWVVEHRLTRSTRMQQIILKNFHPHNQTLYDRKAQKDRNLKRQKHKRKTSLIKRKNYHDKIIIV